MAGAEFRNVNIVGLTGAVPKNIIRNRDLAHALGDETIERIIQMTGVEQMHKALPEPYRNRGLSVGNRVTGLHFPVNIIYYS